MAILNCMELMTPIYWYSSTEKIDNNYKEYIELVLYIVINITFQGLDDLTKFFQVNKDRNKVHSQR